MEAPRSHSSGRPPWLADFVVAASLSIAANSLLTYLVRSGIMADDGFWRWWTTTFFSWQIPAFYCAVGYGFQRGAPASGLAAWAKSTGRRVVVDVVPFIVFTVFLLGVNMLAGDHPTLAGLGVVDALFVTPLEPYGYFYCLFFMIVLVPHVGSRRGLGLLMVVALAAKAFAIVATMLHWPLPYLVIGVADQFIWYAAGMVLAELESERVLRKPVVGIGLSCLYVVFSLLCIAVGWAGSVVTFISALLAGGGILGLLTWAFPVKNARPLHFLAGYTMAIYLFHPPYLKLLWWWFTAISVKAALAYILCGAFVAFVLPVLTLMALNRIWKLGFIVYPARYLKS